MYCNVYYTVNNLDSRNKSRIIESYFYIGNLRHYISLPTVQLRWMMGRRNLEAESLLVFKLLITKKGKITLSPDE